MLKKAICIGIALAASGLATGCTSAGDIAEFYGVIKNPRVTEMIASGEADAMIQNGQAKSRTSVRGSGNDRVRVTEYLIEGTVYRVETRRAIDPTMHIPWTRVVYAEAQQGPKRELVQWGHMLSVWSALKNHSYEARPTVAYRAWLKPDGEVEPMQVLRGDVPAWRPTDAATQLVINTEEWPVPSMWFTGLTTSHDTAVITDDDPEVLLHPLDRFDCSGEWITQSAGSGIQGQPANIDGQTYFVNDELYDVIWGPAW